MLDLILRNNNYTNKQKHIFIIFCIVNILGFGTYSWLSYDINGIPVSGFIYSFLKSLRIILPIALMFYIFRHKLFRIQFLYILNKYKFLYILVIFLFFSTLNSNDFLQSLSYTFWFLFSMLLIHLTIINANSKVDIFKLIKFTCLITLILVILSFNKIIANNETSYFSSKNYYSLVLMFYFFSELYILRYSKLNKFKFLRYFILLLIPLLIFFSGKRAPLFITLLFFIFYILINHNFFISILLTAIFTISFILLTNFLEINLTETLTYSRIDRVTFSELNIEDSSINHRYIIWDYYVNKFKESPLIGFGLNGVKTFDKWGTHNSYLDILLSSGMLGILFFSIYMIRSLFQTKNDRLLFLISLLMIFANFFESNFSPGQLSFYFFFTITSIRK